MKYFEFGTEHPELMVMLHGGGTSYRGMLPTAKEMAKNGAFITGSDVCVSITGIAGPGGGTPEKPVGLVYIACCYHDNITVNEYHFKGEREKVRENTVVRALTLLRECILENSPS